MRNAIGLGLRRGWTEFGQSMRSAGNVANYLVLALVFAVVLFFQRDSTIPGTSMLLGTATLPGMLGLMLVFSGLMGSAGALAVEREDGTLLRCKAVPYGMVGYLVGRIVSLSLGCVVGTVVVLVPGVIVVGGLSFGGWATLVWVFVLGLLATLPWGAMIGSLSRSPQAMSGLVALGVGAVTSISGIFYPITALPGWVRGLAQVLPVYWLGH
ncbi:MAG: ABC transporter permease, partial [Nonomuraea sp.]|nr:ABC transporter permease [Nonomuraea sp.]